MCGEVDGKRREIRLAGRLAIGTLSWVLFSEMFNLLTVHCPRDGLKPPSVILVSRLV